MTQVIAGSTQESHTQVSGTSGFGAVFKTISDPQRSLLMLRFILLNLIAFSLLGVAYSEGHVHTVIAADQTYLSVVIFLVFLTGLGFCAQRIWQTSAELDALNSSDGLTAKGIQHLVSSMHKASVESRANLSGSMRMRLAHRISVVRHLANTLVLLGLIGTVLGFIIALSGVDPETASDVNSIAPMVSTLIQGMSTALYTTLIGSILNVWLMANYQLLSGGTVQLISCLQEAVEKDA
ncbi:hypothetical protein AB833_14460 [Chromatiales bacterium (ex Bugula neritina AB1)]|nr:hypothetical protein AB833_14460 [Chromatiales bacterium (ex Bugula neritina AB1)]